MATIFPTLRIATLSLILCAVLTANASAQTKDRVRVGKTSLSGTITGMSAVKVTLKRRSSEKDIAVNTITGIQFADEPGELTAARLNAETGSFSDALKALGRINNSEVSRKEIQLDIAFYKAFCKAKLAMETSDGLQSAEQELVKFKKRGKKNYHYVQAIETLGDLLVAQSKYLDAEKQYAILARTPWDDFKLKAKVLQGNVLAAQGKHMLAIEQYQAALAISAETDASNKQHLAATLGQAVSMAETGSADKAIVQLEEVIAKADAKEARLHARAYNALGRCYMKADKPKDALLAYLHVDVLYSGYGSEHAEALHYLVPLWKTAGNGEQARKASSLLEERYPNSRWNR